MKVGSIFKVVMALVAILAVFMMVFSIQAPDFGPQAANVEVAGFASQQSVAQATFVAQEAFWDASGGLAVASVTRQFANSGWEPAGSLTPQDRALVKRADISAVLVINAFESPDVGFNMLS